jgi:glycosyltransferase involved in cell wall biosynthesis
MLSWIRLSGSIFYYLESDMNFKMSSLKIMTNTREPLVSICCITYNHEEYIRDAIESFLMQETDFPFEIIIHDDASNDATVDIIREYEMKYPDIIKPIYQTENQYSKGKRVSLFTFMAAKGKYIALCEGDDYWIDPLKLQKQIREMEKCPDCYISFHPAFIHRSDGRIDDRMLGFYSEKTMTFPVEKVILGGGGFMHTGSIILNRLVVPRIISFFDIAKEARSGDYYLQVLGADHGGALYLSDVMSVYRSGVPGSWSANMRNDQNYWALFFRSTIICNNKMSAFTKNKYSNYFNIQNKKLYSSIIRSLYPDIDTKKVIIDKDMDNLYIKDKILWILLFKRPYAVKFLKIVRLFALKVKGS